MDSATGTWSYDFWAILARWKHNTCAEARKVRGFKNMTKNVQIKHKKNDKFDFVQFGQNFLLFLICYLGSAD